MNKKITIVAGAIIVLALAGLGVYFKNKSGKEAAERPSTPAEILNESATKGTLPSLQTNPLENKPDLNPVDAANPFKNIKTNPFK